MSSNAARNLFKLYVANIPWTVSNRELKVYFSKFGHVTNSLVVFDKKTGLSKNYGFITFANREAFENANNFTDHKLEGNTLRVQPSASS